MANERKLIVLTHESYWTVPERYEGVFLDYRDTLWQLFKGDDPEIEIERSIIVTSSAPAARARAAVIAEYRGQHILTEEADELLWPGVIGRNEDAGSVFGFVRRQFEGGRDVVVLVVHDGFPLLRHWIEHLPSDERWTNMVSGTYIRTRHAYTIDFKKKMVFLF